DLDAEVARRRAQILFARSARRTFTAADPGKDREGLPGLHVGVRTGLLHHARDLVAEGEGQGTERRDVELFLAAEAEVAVLQADVGMAHATAADPHQHLRAARFGRLGNRFA